MLGGTEVRRRRGQQRKRLTLELRLTVLKTTKMILVTPPVSNFKMTIRADYYFCI